jgi:spermidine/putrescine transport system ATP-binding protein
MRLYAVFLPQRGMQKMVKNQNIIELHNITVSFDGETVLDDLDLSIKDGEFVTFLGASGCGKTTTLRVIAGFISPDHGDVFFDGARINDLPPHKRQVNTIFQRYALFPHLNVYDNVAFGLKVAGVKKEQIREKVEEMLEMVNMKAFAQRKIHNLSGGQ